MLDLRSASLKSNGVSSCSEFFKISLAHGIRRGSRRHSGCPAIRVTNFDVRFGKIILCMDISRTMAR